MVDVDIVPGPDDKAPPTLAELVELMPQKRPFLFVDEVLEVSEEHAVARYTFRPDEFFYAGHFPGYAVTPGVILLETMTQTSQAFTLAWAIRTRGRAALGTAIGLFVGAEGVEFLEPVLPGATVITRSERVFMRMGLLRARSEIRSPEDGRPLARATTTAIVRRIDAPLSIRGG